MATNQTQPTDVNSALADILNRSHWRQQLALDYTDTAARLNTAYGRILPNLQSSAGGLVDRISIWVANNPDDSLRAEYVRGWKQYQDLLARVEVEMRDFSVLLRNEAGIVQERAVLTAAEGALETAQAVSGGAGQIIASVWNRPDPQALVNLVNYVDGEAFRAGVSAFGENAAQNVADTILAGVAQGKSPRAISNILANWFQLPAAWADNAVRTVQLWSYRGSSHETYKANSDVITGWMWWSSIDVRTCSACLSMHGQIFPLSETLNGHHRCRCSPIPVVKGTNWSADVVTGRDWFDEQSPSVQREILGKGKYELYQNGAFDWNRATSHYDDSVYGRMLRASTLGEMTPWLRSH